MLALSPERAQLEAVDRHLAQCRSRIREQIRRIRACRNRGGDDRTSLELAFAGEPNPCALAPPPDLPCAGK